MREQYLSTPHQLNGDSTRLRSAESQSVHVRNLYEHKINYVSDSV